MHIICYLVTIMVREVYAFDWYTTDFNIICVVKEISGKTSLALSMVMNHTVIPKAAVSHYTAPMIIHKHARIPNVTSGPSKI